jgi:hypothetical protein
VLGKICFFCREILHFSEICLKGPKHEIFGFGFFTLIKPVWIGDVGSRPKNPKLGCFRPENCHFVLFRAVGYNAKDFLTL